jgi:hypothetical protein
MIRRGVQEIDSGGATDYPVPNIREGAEGGLQMRRAENSVQGYAQAMAQFRSGAILMVDCFYEE